MRFSYEGKRKPKMTFPYFLRMMNQIMELKMDPYLDLAHVILCAVAVRDDISRARNLGKGASELQTKVVDRTPATDKTISELQTCLLLHPLDKLCIAHQIISMLKYLVFHSPFDIGYKTSSSFPVKCILTAMKEIRRTRNIHQGVLKANKLFPEAYIVIIIIGTVKGNGSGFMKPVEKLTRGIWNPTATEFLKPSLTTKTGFVASFIFMLDMNTDFSPIPQPLLYFGILIFLIYIKLSSLVKKMEDTFKPLENSISAVIFGRPDEIESKHFEYSSKENEAFRAKKTG